jgi:hypothetical protein
LLQKLFMRIILFITTTIYYFYFKVGKACHHGEMQNF